MSDNTKFFKYDDRIITVNSITSIEFDKVNSKWSLFYMENRKVDLNKGEFEKLNTVEDIDEIIFTIRKNVIYCV